MKTEKTRQWPLIKGLSFGPEASIMALCLSIAVPYTGSAASLRTIDRRFAPTEKAPSAFLDRIGQQRTIKGKVLDNTGRPLPGVTVRVKNTTQETQTDQQGQFELSLTGGTVVLTFSSLGFETREMSVLPMKEL